MNTEQLLSLVHELIDDEERDEIQNKLRSVVQALSNLTSNPQAPDHQTAVARAMDSLNDALDLSYTPATFERMRDIGAIPYFTSAMVARLKQTMDDNAMMPAVVLEEAVKIQDERDDFLIHLNRLASSLEALGFQENGLEEGEAEIGFEIPRALFDNELEGFSKELHELRLIIRAFSEAAGNTGERIVIRQISTTDPLIYLMLGYLTINKIGGAVKWCLDQWKTLEDIRNLRASTANLKGVPAAEAMAKQFDDIIDQTLNARIREEAERLASEAHTDDVRKNELANHISKALEGLLARIERGMKIDIRVLPPPSPEGEADSQEIVTEYERLEQIRDELVFPAVVSDSPILKLEKQPEPQARRRKSSRSNSGD